MLKFIAVMVLATSLRACSQNLKTEGELAATLNKAAKDIAPTQKALQGLADKGTADLNQSQQSQLQQIQAVNIQIAEKIRKDKHYKDLITQIDTLQKSIIDERQKAQSDFEVKTAGLQSQLNKDRQTVAVLVPLVKAANKLPDAATYDSDKQEWIVPDKK